MPRWILWAYHVLLALDPSMQLHNTIPLLTTLMPFHWQLGWPLDPWICPRFLAREFLLAPVAPGCPLYLPPHPHFNHPPFFLTLGNHMNVTINFLVLYIVHLTHVVQHDHCLLECMLTSDHVFLMLDQNGCFLLWCYFWVSVYLKAKKIKNKNKLNMAPLMERLDTLICGSETRLNSLRESVNGILWESWFLSGWF